MSIKQEIFTSFIKGVGKTLGTVVVFGIFGTFFYVYSNKTNYSNVKDNSLAVNVIEETTEENTQETTKQELNMQEIDEIANQPVEDSERVQFVDSKYKVIFDKLLN